MINNSMAAHPLLVEVPEIIPLLHNFTAPRAFSWHAFSRRATRPLSGKRGQHDPPRRALIAARDLNAHFPLKAA